MTINEIELLNYLSFLFCFIPFVLFGQGTLEYSIYPDSDTFLENLKAAHQRQLESYRDGKPLKEAYDFRYGYVQNLFENNIIYYDEELYNFLDEIFKTIKNSNPGLTSYQTRYLVSKSPIPNAYSIGDGTFIFNIGLIRKARNEAQLAYIINHEIAHFVLDHSNASIIEDYKQKNSKGYRKELRKLLRKKYGRYEALKTFMKNDLYIEMAYSRKQEFEADSLGFKYFSNTEYDHVQAYASLRMLDTIDYYKYKQEIDFKTQLGFKAYPFKDRWIKTQQSIFGKASKSSFWDIDSLKSHPEALVRAKTIEVYSDENSKEEGKKYLQDSLTFSSIKSKADVQFIDSWMFYQNLDYALFFILKKLRHHPDDLDLKLKLSEILKLIHIAQKEHKLSNYVSRPGPDNEKEFNTVLVFLNNIRLSELAKLAYFYHQENADSFKANHKFRENFNYFKKTQNL